MSPQWAKLSRDSLKQSQYTLNRSILDKDKIMTNIYFAELTDTFGGEANYSWVTRFKVQASSPLGAIQKLSKETGLNFRKQWDDGFTTRYDSRSGASCIFITPYADEAETFSRVVSL